MNSGTNRIFDELAKLFTDTGSAAQNIRKETETILRMQVEKMVNKLDLVKREEFEVLKEMAAKAIEENNLLKTRLEELEKKADLAKKPEKEKKE